MALTRALDFADSFDASVRLVHSLPGNVRALDQVAQDAVLRWAMRRAGIALNRDDVLIRVGDPAEALDDVATESAADLIVAARPRLMAGCHVARSQIIDALLTSYLRPVFIAAEPRNRKEIVAATDLENANFPIVLWAARLGRALNASVTIVHCVEPDGPGLSFRLDDALQRLDMLHRFWKELRTNNSGGGGRRKAGARDAGDAIASAAAARNADITIVGVRPNRGRTLDAVIERTNGSVLAIPLGAGSSSTTNVSFNASLSAGLAGGDA